jgi:hypothetical protein
MRIFRHMLTGCDNKTYDIVRVGMFVAFALVCAENVWGMCITQNLDLEKLGELMKSFSVSIANILGWGSVGCAAKSHTEPQGQHFRFPLPSRQRGRVRVAEISPSP